MSAKQLQNLAKLLDSKLDHRTKQPTLKPSVIAALAPLTKPKVMATAAAKKSK